MSSKRERMGQDVKKGEKRLYDFLKREFLTGQSERNVTEKRLDRSIKRAFRVKKRRKQESNVQEYKRRDKGAAAGKEKVESERRKAVKDS